MHGRSYTQKYVMCEHGNLEALCCIFPIDTKLLVLGYTFIIYLFCFWATGTEN